LPAIGAAGTLANAGCPARPTGEFARGSANRPTGRAGRRAPTIRGSAGHGGL